MRSRVFSSPLAGLLLTNSITLKLATEIPVAPRSITLTIISISMTNSYFLRRSSIIVFIRSCTCKMFSIFGIKLSQIHFGTVRVIVYFHWYMMIPLKTITAVANSATTGFSLDDRDSKIGTDISRFLLIKERFSNDIFYRLIRQCRRYRHLLHQFHQFPLYRRELGQYRVQSVCYISMR